MPRKFQPPAMADDDPVLTAEDLAQYLRVHRTSVYRFLKYKGLPGFKLGSDWRFRKSKVDAWLVAQQGEIPAES
jgi:excisionase family DNA binding protein